MFKNRFKFKLTKSSSIIKPFRYSPDSKRKTRPKNKRKKPVLRVLIFTHPGSRISDPKTAIKERGEKKIIAIPFFVTINFTKLKIILFLEC
jgi:hypothetical protein